MRIPSDFDIGIRIRDIRTEELHDTQEDFAIKLGITRKHLGKIERGESSLTATRLILISLLTGISADFILFGETKKNKLTTKDNIIRILDLSTTKEIKHYYKYICELKDLDKYYRLTSKS